MYIMLLHCLMVRNCACKALDATYVSEGGIIPALFLLLLKFQANCRPLAGATEWEILCLIGRPTVKTRHLKSAQQELFRGTEQRLPE
jgi:hypothetical protein